MSNVTRRRLIGALVAGVLATGKMVREVAGKLIEAKDLTALVDLGRMPGSE